MTSSLFTRVQKLESRQKTDDKVLLFWMRPGEDVPAAVQAATKAGLFATGDLVICLEWLGTDPMPKPRWLSRDRAYFGKLSEQEDHCITAMLEKRIATVDAAIATGEPIEVPGLARPMPRDIREISSVDLMYCALGVQV